MYELEMKNCTPRPDARTLTQMASIEAQLLRHRAEKNESYNNFSNHLTRREKMFFSFKAIHTFCRQTIYIPTHG